MPITHHLARIPLPHYRKCRESSSALADLTAFRTVHGVTYLDLDWSLGWLVDAFSELGHTVVAASIKTLAGAHADTRWNVVDRVNVWSDIGFLDPEEVDSLTASLEMDLEALIPNAVETLGRLFAEFDTAPAAYLREHYRKLVEFCAAARAGGEGIVSWLD